MEVRLSRFGPCGVLVRFADELDADSLSLCRGLVRWVDDHPPEGLVDCVPACTALLLEFAEPVSERRLRVLRQALRIVRPLPAEEATLHTLPVVYDGEDLEELAARKNLPVAEVVSRHAAPTYSVYVIGFAPGFPYLGPLDEKLHLPRRSTPRLRVPAGSVAIGGEHTGIYSIASPGGWWLIGRTPVGVFSPELARGDGDVAAFRLQPGDRVRLEPVSP
jgi:KipI family sensor histidine kinase inhibitor